MDIRHCKYGHEKQRRTHGWKCLTCEKERSKNRYAREKEKDAHMPKKTGVASTSTPVGSVCKLGHQRVRRPNGELACPACQNAWKRARRAAERNRACPHATRPGYEGIISEKGNMVCLACLVAEMDAA